ncbi:MAG: hypothetical protein JOZ25_08650, partial [Actinobacteria bacterium]|nr:hypothetical protein [Actinomycetota bacterium]
MGGSLFQVGGRQVAGKATRLTAGTATILAGALSIGSAITPDVPWRRELLLSFEPSTAARLGHLLAAAAGLCLVGLGWGIINGRRGAARTATIVLLAVAVIHALKGLDYEESLVAVTLALLLHFNRRVFRRGGASRASLVAGMVAVGAAAAAYTLNTVDLLMSDRARDLDAALQSSGHALVASGWWLRSDEPIAIALDLLVAL